MRAREPNSCHWTRQVRKRRHYHRQWNSWPIRCHRTWTRELAAPQVPMAVRSPSTCWRLKIISSQFLMLLIRWTSGTTEWTFMSYDKLSLFAQDIFLVRLQVRRKGFFCVWSAYCWSQKQNDQVIAKLVWNWINKYWRTQASITLMEMNCK